MTAPTTTAVQLRADDLLHRYGDRTVLDGVTLVAGAGERLGLVGENGVGKSTLLRLLAGVEAPDAGTVAATGTRGLLAQRVDLSRFTTVGQLLDSALADVRSLHAERERLEHALHADPAHDALL